MLHSTCTHQGQTDSRLLVVGSQTTSLTLGPSFCHNLCCRCPNGSCEAIFNIYTSIDFQWYEECLKASFFDPCNRTLKFLESRRTPKSPFQECLTLFQKWGCNILVAPPSHLSIWTFFQLGLKIVQRPSNLHALIKGSIAAQPVLNQWNLNSYWFRLCNSNNLFW